MQLNPYIFVKTDFFDIFFFASYSSHHDVLESVLLLSWAVLVQKLWMSTFSYLFVWQT